LLDNLLVKAIGVIIKKGYTIVTNNSSVIATLFLCHLRLVFSDTPQAAPQAPAAPPAPAQQREGACKMGSSGFLLDFTQKKCGT
jgi:hypothetical protein